ncbi:MAG: RluA family pseudouridine synthase [Bacteroidota bacterium]
MNIILEDAALLVIDKPAGLSTESGISPHPSAEVEMLAYVTENLNRDVEVGGFKKAAYLRAVHRLDRPASGILIFAKAKHYLTEMMLQFERGQVQKSYRAQVSIAPPETEGVLSHFIKKDETGRKSLVFDHAETGAQPCSLHYKVLSEKDGETLLEIVPSTGRFHQIRAQLAHIGSPIVGDVQYGGQPWLEHSIKLHACRLALLHPRTEEDLILTLDTPGNW